MPTQEEFKLDGLIARRENIFSRTQRCYDVAKDVERNPNSSSKLEAFSIRYDTFSNVVQEFHSVVEEIVILKQKLKQDEAPNYDLLNTFDDLYSTIEYLAAKCLSSSTPDPPESTDPDRRLRMPKLELVKFSGNDLSVWPLFYENFKYLVHRKTEFAKVKKLQYLLGSLTGKALVTCNAFEATPNNYDSIWKLLEDTYNDKKYLAGLYLDRILNFRSSPSR
ncbi:unnamed protein product [Psylliodes chrysocephalus]|uniref:Uncharacterized protein n=1 Tax=Psylliodes chrysocephalus TaxID=3402493 RepID=A0A9P0GEK4_9CUCU|nr:unnamed protein product [Psylliodes chrysocephala]